MLTQAFICQGPDRTCASWVCFALTARIDYNKPRTQLNVPALTRLIVHHADGFGFGQLQCRDPSLPLHFCASLEVVSAAATAQDNVAGVLCVDVRRGQVDCSSASMGHLCLRPATKHQAEKETEKEHT